jgi:hypothetical protein
VLYLWTTISTILVKILVTDFCDNCGDNFDDTYFGEVDDFLVILLMIHNSS